MARAAAEAEKRILIDSYMFELMLVKDWTKREVAEVKSSSFGGFVRKNEGLAQPN
jgi:hypothetical protein